MPIGLFLLATAATANQHAAPATQTRAGLVASYTAMMKRIDTDGDGEASRAEWEAMVDASPMLQSLSISQAQRAGLRASLIAGFARDDSDKDGLLTLDELMARPLVRFACLDSNHDGKLGPAEIAANLDRCSVPAGIPN
jgi:hypothetical protein